MKNIFSSKQRLNIAIAMIVGLCTTYVLYSPFAGGLNRFTYDSMYLLRGPRASAANIVVVSIDQQSFANLGLKWPWPRSLHAELVRKLTDAGARVIAFDVLFAEPSLPEEDSELRQASDAHGRVIFGAQRDVHVTQHGSYVTDVFPSETVFSERSHIGLVNMNVDADGFIRRAPVAIDGVPSLAMQTVVQAGEGEAAVATLKDSESFLINFVSPPPAFRTAHYYQALDPDTYLPPNFFKDAIVLVGLNVQDEVDALSTGPDRLPYTYTRGGHGYTAGVLLHAHSVSSVIDNAFIREVSFKTIYGLTLGIALLSPALFSVMSTAAGAAFLLLCALGLAGNAYLLFVRGHTFIPVAQLWLPLLTVYLTLVFLRFWHTWREKQFIQRAFSTYLSPRLVHELVRDPSRLALGGEEATVTTLFLDIVGFTTLSEKRDPEQLITILNEFLGAHAQVVIEHDGLIDKFIGDALMAVWGVPFADEAHASKACRAALQMDRLCSELSQEGEAPLSIRIGLNSGRVVAGNVGGGQSFNYTVLGNEVNVAARLEGANKFYGTRILVGENTYEETKDLFIFRKIDRVNVVGKNEAIAVFELLGAHDEVSEKLQAGVRAFNDAQRFYEKRAFTEAKAAFTQYLEVVPDDQASILFIARCEAYLASPPPATWDASFRLEQK